MTGANSAHEYYDGDDIAALAARISATTSVDSDGSPWWLEPEPNEIEKRRFRPDREVLTGYTATFSAIGPGSRKPDEAIVFHVAFDRPDSGAELTDDSLAELLADHAVSVPSGWTVHTDWGNGFRAEALDVRRTSPTEIAAFVFAALRALGAHLPSGRWRVTG